MEAVRTFLIQLGPRRLILMGGVALALLAALAFVATRNPTSEMGFLYTDLDSAAAKSIADKLAAQDIPYRLSADGTSILAPQDKLPELRMSMAEERLGGKVGYEVLDAEQPFGVSASRAKLGETRAIEGELGKSIESLDTVERARVHIVMPERAMFATETRKATAAVTVRTRGRLPSETVAAIRYLVSSSVPELAPESVSVVDQTGALLARAGDPDGAGASDADAHQAAIETKLRDQIEALIEPIVGQGKVRAEVAAQVDRDQSREESTVYDPDKQVIARQVSVETGDQNNETETARPLASVSAQLPESVGQAGDPGGPNRRSASNQSSEETSYENSSARTVTVRTPGKVTRLTVAVMIDSGDKGLAASEIQRLTKIVENAVGIDSQRGDSVIIESMKFAAADDLVAKDGGWLSLISADRVFGLVQLVLIAVVGLVALRMLKPRLAPPTEPVTALLPSDAERLALAERAANGDEEAAHQLAAAAPPEDYPLLDHEIALAQVDGRIKLSALKRVGDAITANPPEAASVIRQWMNA